MSATSPPKWAKLIDQTQCIGCHACTTACKSENEVPLAVTRTYVKSVDVGVFPEARRAFQVTRCNQCEDAPCTVACPTGAMYRRPDGIVDFDKSICIGCKACIAACPYDAIFINPNDHSAEKCNFCAHRIDVGLEPSCVVVCPTQAIVVGDLNDPTSRISRMVHREPVSVRRPEKDTKPKLFYRGAHEATLDPIAARRPKGGLFAWAEQKSGPEVVNSGHPDGAGINGRPGWNSSAAAVLSYDVPHSAPWDWRVSLYTWTKGIAAGAYLVPLLLAVVGILPWNSPLWLWTAPGVALIFLAATAALLIWDLEHPERFHFILTRPQWQSWLTRGALILMAYGAVLAAHWVASLLGSTDAQRTLAFAGGPLAVATAAYTAYLFAQAKGRDLWQNPLLPAHMVVQCVVLGAAALLGDSAALARAIARSTDGIAGAAPALTAASAPTAMLSWVLAAGCATHLVLLFMESTLPHATAHARLATWEMSRGRYARVYLAGVILVAVGAFAPWIGGLAALAALAGVLAHEHAYVQSGQAVPLA